MRLPAGMTRERAFASLRVKVCWGRSGGVKLSLEKSAGEGGPTTRHRALVQVRVMPLGVAVEALREGGRPTEKGS